MKKMFKLTYFLDNNCILCSSIVDEATSIELYIELKKKEKYLTSLLCRLRKMSSSIFFPPKKRAPTRRTPSSSIAPKVARKTSSRSRVNKMNWFFSTDDHSCRSILHRLARGGSSLRHSGRTKMLLIGTGWTSP